MSKKINVDNISVVLHQSRYPENIGSVARALCNMGFSRLVVVDPPNYDRNKILKLATHAALDVVEKIKISTDLKDALSHFNYVVGATARLGGQRQVVNTPSKLAQKLAPISLENRIAILFGPEDRGLSNEDIRNCHGLVNIPTADFSSLNLAQAVMIICYEIFSADLEKHTEFIPRLATRHELNGMYDQLKDILVRISYINPENPDYWMNKLRHFFSRLQLRAKEVSIIRGICRQVDWYGKKCYEDGQNMTHHHETREQHAEGDL
jgi:tRNA/rRNA methyltransferase